MSALARHYAKFCDPRDFDDSEVLSTIRGLVPERDPKAYVERKVWEFAMVMLMLRETGHLDGRSRVLSVGAGNERILFWLTNHVRRMVATDIYGEGAFAAREAHASMLEDPAAHAPAYGWEPDRLEVHRMDARSLEFTDGSFDAVFSVSSIEHFGSPADVARSAAEMGRVLRAGGHAMIITECFVRRHPLNAAPVDLAVRLATMGRRRKRAGLRARGTLAEVFTPSELDRLIVRPSGLAWMQEPDFRPPTGSPALDGAILMRASRSVFTSFCLPLVKAAPDNSAADGAV